MFLQDHPQLYITKECLLEKTDLLIDVLNKMHELYFILSTLYFPAYTFHVVKKV